MTRPLEMQQRAANHPSVRAKRRHGLIVLIGAVLYFFYFAFYWTDPTIPRPAVYSVEVPAE